jgi:hypothetical protein
MLRRLMMSGGASDAGQPNWANVGSLLHFEGPNGSTAFSDEKALVWTGGGGASISTGRSLFGGASYRGTGAANSYIETPTGSIFDFRGDFTLDASVYIDSDAAAGPEILSVDGMTSAHAGHGLGITGSNLPYITYAAASDPRQQVAAIGPAALPKGQWIRLRGERFGSILSMYVNGIRVAQITSSTTPAAPAGRKARIGAYYNGTEALKGNIDEFRWAREAVVKGAATYTLDAGAFPDS